MSTGKKFHNVAKEGLKFGDEGETHQEQFDKLVEEYKPLTTWLKDTALTESVSNNSCQVMCVGGTCTCTSFCLYFNVLKI